MMPREPCPSCGVRITIKPTRVRPGLKNKCAKCFRKDLRNGIDRCAAKTREGRRCGHQRNPESDFCMVHEMMEVKT
jgi:hypothetical protein